jgi:peptidoglycan/LPS O-acetylase OafA/YrhL
MLKASFLSIIFRGAVMWGLSLNKKDYPFLDGFRAFAILWVLIHHIGYRFDLSSYMGGYYAYFHRLAFLGFLGVDMFFVISGFLITGLLMDGVREGRIDWKKFYIRRSFKIVPQYICAVLVGFLLTKNLNSFEPWRYFVFLQNYGSPVSVPLLGHLWSIAVEEHFYFIYPLLLSWACAVQKKAERRQLLLTIVFVVLMAFCNMFRYYSFSTVHSINDPSVWQATHLRFDALLFGCLLKIGEPYLVPVHLCRRSLHACFYFALGMYSFVSFFIRFNKIGWLDYMLVYWACGSLILAALNGYTPLVKILEASYIRWIGRISYGLYLWHCLPLKYFAVKSLQWGVMRMTLLYVACSILLGWLSTISLERFFLNLRERVVPRS